MDGSDGVARVFAELADTLVEGFDVVEFLQVLTERCVGLLHVDAAAFMLADPEGELRLLAGTVVQSESLDVFELQIHGGPGRDCFIDARPLTNVMLRDAHHMWPRFTPVALVAGFRATHAIPMRLRRQMIGVLNLFSRAEARLGADDLAVAQALADVATIGLLHEDTLRQQTVLSEQLQNALQTRAAIERAKGVVAAEAGMAIRATAGPRS